MRWTVFTSRQHHHPPFLARLPSPWTVIPLPSPLPAQPFKMAQLPVLSEEDRTTLSAGSSHLCVYLESYCLGSGGNRVCAVWHLQGVTCLSECRQGQVTDGLPSMKFSGQRAHSCPFYSPRVGFQELRKEAEQSAGSVRTFFPSPLWSIPRGQLLPFSLFRTRRHE